MKKSFYLLIALIVIVGATLIVYQYIRVAESEISQANSSSDTSTSDENVIEQRNESGKLEAPTIKEPNTEVTRKNFSKAGIVDEEAIDLALEHNWNASTDTVDYLNALAKVTKDNYVSPTIKDKTEARRLWLDSSIVFAFGHQKQIENIIRGDEALLTSLKDLVPLVEKEAGTNSFGGSAENTLPRVNRVINLLDFFGHRFSEESFKEVLATYPEPGALQETWGGLRSAYVPFLEDPGSELGRKLIELDSEVFGP